MLQFVELHKIRPAIEQMPMADIQKGIERTREGKARYRVVVHF